MPWLASEGRALGAALRRDMVRDGPLGNEQGREAVHSAALGAQSGGVLVWEDGPEERIPLLATCPLVPLQWGEMRGDLPTFWRTYPSRLND